jgi:hypothetical protein
MTVIGLFPVALFFVLKVLLTVILEQQTYFLLHLPIGI